MSQHVPKAMAALTLAEAARDYRGIRKFARNRPRCLLRYLRCRPTTSALAKVPEAKLARRMLKLARVPTTWSQNAQAAAQL